MKTHALSLAVAMMISPTIRHNHKAFLQSQQVDFNSPPEEVLEPIPQREPDDTLIDRRANRSKEASAYRLERATAKRQRRQQRRIDEGRISNA